MKHGHSNLLVALAGQPNSGKSSVFNMLTGSSQHVANFPGVTVERKEGLFTYGGVQVDVVDLPGTYSLTSYSPEERIARDFLLLERPEVVVAVVDASNLARHLYLVFQLREMRIPMVLCLNMMDIARRRGFEIDTKKLSELLGMPVVPTVAHRREGREELQRVILETAESADHDPGVWKVNYGSLESVIDPLTTELKQYEHLMEDFPPRWLAVKLMENDAEARRILLHHTHDGRGSQLLATVDNLRGQFVENEQRGTERLIASARYAMANEIVEKCVRRIHEPRRRWSDEIDRWVCHPIAGIFFVILVMFAVFHLTFQLSDGWEWIPWGDRWITPVGFFGWIFGDLLPSFLSGMEEGAFRSLLEDGVLGGVGGVMGFIPVIFFMFILIGVVEDSGYVARIAFVLDRFLRRFGLQGQSALPLILAGGITGGCAVPGVLATRTIRDNEDRLTTMLVAPFMLCGAKLPTLAVLIAAFFSTWKGGVLLALATLCWITALGSALLLRKTVIRGPQAEFVIEIPPYHRPSFENILRNAWIRTWMYIKKAGTWILAVSILLWALMYFPRPPQRLSVSFEPIPTSATKTQEAISSFSDPSSTERNPIDPGGRGEGREKARGEETLRDSWGGRLGQWLEPLTRLAGFDWRENIALLGGFAAKEVIVSVLSTAYQMERKEGVPSREEHLLARRLRGDPTWSPGRAAALMVFVALYSPCIATLIAIWRESGAWKWAILSTVYSTLVAFVIATAIYQTSLLLS